MYFLENYCPVGRRQRMNVIFIKKAYFDIYFIDYIIGLSWIKKCISKKTKSIVAETHFIV